MEKLNKKQVALIKTYRDKWLKIGLSTKPADRAKAEAGVDLAYKAAGLPPPKFKVWLRSPLEGAYAAGLVKSGQVYDQVGDQVRAQVGAQIGAQVGAQVYGQVSAQVSDQVYDQVYDQVGAQVRGQVSGQVYAQVYDQVRDQVGAQVRAQVGAQVYDQVYDQVRDQVYTSLWGQHDYWLSFYDYFKGAKLPKMEPILGLIQVAESCGWWWAFSDIAILTERPTHLARDEGNRLHCQTRAAIEYPDGFGVYAWHGTRVPKEWILTPETLTPEVALSWPNVEQRRCAAEIIGWAKILSSLKARTVDKDSDPQIGELLEVDLPDAPKQKFLRVQCGTKREFCLPVPPEMKTALQSNMWTFGIEDVGSAEWFRSYEVRT